MARSIRLGGMVEKGSRPPRGRRRARTVSSSPTARRASRSRFRGIIPDLFREGSGVVVEGRLAGRRHVLVADNILAKHDERYMPPELGNLAAEHKAAKTLER